MRISFLSNKIRHYICWVGAGLIVEIALLVLRHYWNYPSLILPLWFLAIGLTGIPFFLRRVRSYPPFLGKNDVMPVLLLVGIAIPLYSFLIDRLPIQMAVDEVVTLMETRDTFVQTRDWLGPSHYHDYPTLGYVCFGSLAKLLGGPSITVLREINVFLGVVIVAALYVLYRTCSPKLVSLSAASVAGFNHSLIGLSKAGIRANVDVLIEVVAYTILIQAARLRCQFLAFLGGVGCGSAYYFYYPARSTIVIWGLTSVLAAISMDRVTRRSILQLYAISFLAFTVTALPEMVASLERADPYVKQQLLFTKEGMAQQMDREQTDSPVIAYINNVNNSLTAFNTAKPDHWSNYWNPSFGFVEPVTGILLWIGLLASIRFRKADDRVNWLNLVSIVGFCLLLFLYTFVIGTAPAYTRLVVLLPFVGLLAVNGALFLAKWIDFVLQKQGFSSSTSAPFIVTVLTIFCFKNNLETVSSYLNDGYKYGDRFGATIRYVEERSDRPYHKFYIVTPLTKATPDASFLTWKTGIDSVSLLKAVAPANEIRAVEPSVFCAELSSGLIDGKPIVPPLTVFVVKRFTPCLDDFVCAYPQMKMHPITPDYEFEALEIER